MKLIICIKIDLALNNLKRLICHKTQTNQTSYQSYHNQSVEKKYLLNSYILFRRKTSKDMTEKGKRPLISQDALEPEIQTLA